MFDHRIKNCEQLAHASDQGDFEQFALGDQPIVEVPNHGIASSGNQGSHVQRTAHWGSAAPDGAPTLERATVAVEGGDTDERGNLLAISVPSSGNSASKVRLVTGPMPLALRSRSSFSFQIGLCYGSVELLVVR